MDYRAPLSATIFAFCAGAAHAGYAQLSPPAGFSSSGGVFSYAASVNDVVASRVITQSNALAVNVGGQSVKMSAAYRLASNAPRIAAAAIFANPTLRSGVAIAAWLGVGSFVWDQINRVWLSPDTEAVLSDGFIYSARNPNTGVWDLESASPAGVCAMWAAAASSPGYTYSVVSASVSSCEFRRNGASTIIGADLIRRSSTCPAGWYVTSAGCVQTPNAIPVTLEDFVKKLNPDNQPGWPMPDGVPQELRGVPLPVEQPVINPTPGTDPKPQPFFVPSGNPVKNPNYDPSKETSTENQPYIQPGVRVVPSSTASSPWQVDLQPVNRPVASAEPNTGTVTETGTESDSDTASDESLDLCEKHPEIIACQKLEKPDEVKLPTSEFDFHMTPDSGFAGGGACPAPITATVGGHVISISWQHFCDQLGYVRAFFLALAWLTAAYILLGVRD